MATAEIAVRVTPNNTPAEKITVHFAGAELTMSALQVAELLIDKVRAGQLAPAANQPPAIGSAWPEQGGIYAGIARGRGGAPDYHVIVAEPERSGIVWDDAMAWALGIRTDVHHDFTLPTRPEQALLFANVKELFADAAYWSETQYAGDAGCAWFQGFSYGGQDYYGKSASLRARAVRRVPIQ